MAQVDMELAHSAAATSPCLTDILFKSIRQKLMCQHACKQDDIRSEFASMPHKTVAALFLGSVGGSICCNFAMCPVLPSDVKLDCCLACCAGAPASA
jgi:hypothetical protein